MEQKKKYPQYTDKMIDDVSDILKSGRVNYWTGNKVKDFEKQYSEYFGCNYSIAVSNGSIALELCLKAIDLKKDDEVIVTSRSFIASASSINLCGGIPIFCDVNYFTQNITLFDIKRNISEKTKAVILVHYNGVPCDEIYEICNYCKSNNIFVIEDCAQCHGAKYCDKYLGTFGDISAWSFCQDKIISTGGEGGMITTDNKELYQKVWSLKDHGKVMNENNYDITDFGSNYRMTEIQASIGINSLVLLDEWVKIRRRNTMMLNDVFSKYDFIITNKSFFYNSNKFYCSCYKYYFYIDKSYVGYKKLREIIISEFKKNGISEVFSGYRMEIYDEICYKNKKNFILNNECHNSKQIGDTCIMLCCDPTYTEDIMKIFVAKIETILDNICENSIAIVGCGGHSRVITDIAIKNGFYIIGYIGDMIFDKNYVYRNISYLCSNYFLSGNKIFFKIIIGFGDLKKRNDLINNLEDKNLKYANIIDKSAIISDTVKIGFGNVIMPNVVINSSCEIGNHCIFNTSSIIEHDCIIGDNTHFCPASVICGGIKIGNNTLFGANSVCKNSTNNNKITIGNNVIIGCGSVVLNSICDNNTVHGVI